MQTDDLFFPRLRRRELYRLTSRGEYYKDYSTYRQEIREDCLGRCVYCDSHENELDGPESMDLDHFRPKAYEEFNHLVNDPNNLVWSCKVCNVKKWNYWPAIGTDDTFVGDEGFIDPFKEDRREYFEVHQDGGIIALRPPATYMISLLALNRPTPKRRRQFRHQAYELLPRVEAEISKLERLSDLSDTQRKSLELFRALRSNYEDRLDFGLR